MHREVLYFVKQTPGIILVYGNFGLAHVRDLFYPGRVVEVAMGKDDGLDPLLVRCYCHGQNPGIYQDISYNVGVCPHISVRYPIDLHAQ